MFAVSSLCLHRTQTLSLVREGPLIGEISLMYPLIGPHVKQIRLRVEFGEPRGPAPPETYRCWCPKCSLPFLSPGRRHFKCSYCPYSASQKGNLKTHVLCVHRMAFDNNLYPDRRFKRSRPDCDIPEKSLDDAGRGVPPNHPMTDRSNVMRFGGEAEPRHWEWSRHEMGWLIATRMEVWVGQRESHILSRKHTLSLSDSLATDPWHWVAHSQSKHTLCVFLEVCEHRLRTHHNLCIFDDFVF